MKNNTNVVKILQADFNTILLHAEKISNGQLDFIQVLREELKNKLGIEDADSLIDFLKTTPAEYVMETRLFLAQFNLIIEGEGVNYRLVKLNDNYCELEPIPENTAAIVPAKNNNAVIPEPTLDQRVIKIQFHLQNMANSAIIIGQELIECKKEVGHGNWTIWLKDNFNLSQDTATNFMKIAKRFGANSEPVRNLGYTQMLALVSLPAGDEEKFLAAMDEKGTPYKNMTKREANAAVKDWKAEAEKLKKENDELKNNPPQVIETTKTIMPPNYLETIQRAEELQEQVDQLLEQNQDLQNQVIDAASKQGEPKIEFVTPADYEENKKQLAILQAEKDTLTAQQENLRVDMAISQHLNTLGAVTKFLLDNQDRLTANIDNFICADFTTDNIKQLAQLVTLLVNNVDGDFEI